MTDHVAEVNPASYAKAVMAAEIHRLEGVMSRRAERITELEAEAADQRRLLTNEELCRDGLIKELERD